MGHRSLAAGLGADARRGVHVATGALLAVAIVELIATIVTYTGPRSVVGMLKLVPLDLTLIAIAWVIAAPLCAALTAMPRALLAALRGREAARGYDGLAVQPLSGIAVARLWGLFVAASLYVLWSSRTTFAATQIYKELRLMGLLLALKQVIAIGVLAIVGVAVAAGVDRLRRLVDRLTTRFNPFGRPLPAVAVGAIVAVIALMITAHRMPQLRPLIPWRWLLAALAAYAGGALTLARLRRGDLVPRDRKVRRKIALAVAAAVLFVVPATLLRLGGDVDAKGMAITASPLLERLIGVVRTANDLDRDGFGSLLGENDCAPLDRRIHPGARDVPDNGVDENCNGRDSSLRDLVAPAGETMPVPEAFQKPWNILLVTIDTVRYDHTSFGGYVEKRKRDTTPHLKELVDRSVSFTFANAPSAGTMASVPAILTSKFFHSGIALEDPKKRGAPPRLAKANTTLPEIMKRAGYKTGAILSHEYFNDWGMDQGVDAYDNEIGKTPDAFRISSHQSTDRALAWISSRARDKWFLWVHYLDPHGRYVSHPGTPGWGTTEEDLYDGELRFTDEHVGRLLDELARLPGAERTIVIITSDHGDAFNEHGFTNHGQALYRELLHVPLIVAVPDLPARQIGGAVSPMDIVPTIADLCGIDVSDLSFEGRSLVPQIFYGKEDPDRVVFAETNYPKPLRAAVSERWKLVYDLQNNLYQLYDLRTDPWEKTNLAGKDPTSLAAMKEQLDAWLERVVFARDKVFNQAASKVAGVLLASRPSPRFATSGVTFDEGRIAVLGFAPQGEVVPGKKVKVSVDLEVKDRPSGAFKLQLALRGPARTARSSMRTTGDGYLPSDRWHPGEFIHETFEVSVPADWTGASVDVGLTMQGADGKVTFVGPALAGESTTAMLGTMPLLAPEKPGNDAGVAPVPIKVGGSPARAP